MACTFADDAYLVAAFPFVVARTPERWIVVVVTAEAVRSSPRPSAPRSRRRRRGSSGTSMANTVLAPYPAWWFLDCGLWTPDMPHHWRIGDRSMEPRNRDAGQYVACEA